jgi:hypothetical protein
VPARDLESIDLCDILNAVRDERQYETWLLGRARTDPDADAVARPLHPVFLTAGIISPQSASLRRCCCAHWRPQRQ